MIKIKFHSIVDVITNSSTVIYTYQNSVTQAKELVEEMLKLAGITDKNPDDIFYYGVFCEDDRYLDDNEDLPNNFPKYSWSDSDRESKQELQEKLLYEVRLSIMKGGDKPEWMKNRESDDYSYDPDSYLCLIPKEEKYKLFGEKIKSLLGSISADGGHDG